MIHVSYQPGAIQLLLQSASPVELPVDGSVRYAYMKHDLHEMLIYPGTYKIRYIEFPFVHFLLIVLLTRSLTVCVRACVHVCTCVHVRARMCVSAYN